MTTNLILDKWERNYAHTEHPKYTFPEPDLAQHLIALYFDCVNLHLPLLHRPTFEKWVEEGLHHTDENFTPVYLLVCAVGARHSNDPRAKLEGINSYHSCGWKWFDQVQMIKRAMISPPTLFDIQSYCVCETISHRLAWANDTLHSWQYSSSRDHLPHSPAGRLWELESG